MVSRIPPVSPASTMFTYKASKTLGEVRIAAESGHIEFLALFGHFRRCDLLSLQQARQFGLVRSGHHPADAAAGAAGPLIFIVRHLLASSVFQFHGYTAVQAMSFLLALAARRRLVHHSRHRYAAIDHILQFIGIR